MRIAPVNSLEEFGAKAYSDIDAFLADPELEIVTVGTPSGAHLDPTLAALNAGKHAIVEKPLEITTERIDQLIDAAATNGKTLASILNRRFHPGMDAFKKAADERSLRHSRQCLRLHQVVS